MLVLLDLLGARQPNFYSYFQNTFKWYSILSMAEDQLASEKLLQEYDYRNKYFKNYNVPAGIEDDHIPFLRKSNVYLVWTIILYIFFSTAVI